MEKVRPWCGQPSDRGRLKNRTEENQEKYPEEQWPDRAMRWHSQHRQTDRRTDTACRRSSHLCDYMLPLNQSINRDVAAVSDSLPHTVGQVPHLHDTTNIQYAWRVGAKTPRKGEETRGTFPRHILHFMHGEFERRVKVFDRLLLRHHVLKLWIWSILGSPGNLLSNN